ncbi:hypothetical protein CRG98_028291 [Punica granatum]|uniref:Uncharacterized protein n=1 Tax=Punica granatum TaxID=22663 RepID=A0A2I0J527_PUNGR|nr:hypothetical protein CRG98_028291 [Punica granatum]
MSTTVPTRSLVVSVTTGDLDSATPATSAASPFLSLRVKIEMDDVGLSELDAGHHRTMSPFDGTSPRAVVAVCIWYRSKVVTLLNSTQLSESEDKIDVYC